MQNLVIFLANFELNFLDKFNLKFVYYHIQN
jgi:hypothetical protein